MNFMLVFSDIFTSKFGQIINLMYSTNQYSKPNKKTVLINNIKRPKIEGFSVTEKKVI